ncbi:hypothetical protein AXF42_Ash000628 [Apostasia shenzhenica]|uniref:Uncharacterized protein n=1 Tax=Apostasia shenzhenica TaxID=1088818 RepID=A0A2I0AGW1_9ASPA|nr:hypothetical protein AXF42_Ash000628 [Apostasia shenzhenica]
MIVDFTYGPMSPVREYGGRRAMWHMITEYKLPERQSKVTFGDGSTIPEEAIRAYNEAQRRLCGREVGGRRCFGTLDNLTVQHSRRPGKPPRVVLVSLSLSNGQVFIYLIIKF